MHNRLNNSFEDQASVLDRDVFILDEAIFRILIFSIMNINTCCIYQFFPSSFLDDAFRKNLESSLRFGNPLLVQDVESYDPILNPVLNKELRRTGGRVLITIGDQDIDLSPAFTIFLSTRDPTVCKLFYFLHRMNFLYI